MNLNEEFYTKLDYDKIRINRIMEAKNFRIGNFTQIENKKHYPLFSDEIFEVTEIKKSGLGLENALKDDDVFEINQKYKFIKPIKLTEDWLLKFGFKNKGVVNNKINLKSNADNGFDNAIIYDDEANTVFYFNKKFYYIIDQNYDDYGCNYTDKELKFIHEFQNLNFALNQKELMLIYQY